MAGVKISGLPADPSPTLTSIFPVVHDGVTYKQAGTAFPSLLSPFFLSVAGGSLSGILNMTLHKITNVTDPTSPQDAATSNYVSSNFLSLSGGTLSGSLNMGSNLITHVTDPVSDQDATTKKYVADNFLALSGGTLSGQIDMDDNKIINLADATTAFDAVSKSYADSHYLTSGIQTQDLDMGSHYIKNLLDPVNTDDAVNKNYADSNFLPSGVQIADLDMGGHFINNISDPVSAFSAATKNYVDTHASPSITWNDITSSPQNLSVGNGYFIKNTGGVTSVHLPSTCAKGDMVWVVGSSIGQGWIAYPSVGSGDGLNFVFGSVVLAAYDTLSSISNTDSMLFICSQANTTWQACSVVGATLLSSGLIWTSTNNYGTNIKINLSGTSVTATAGFTYIISNASLTTITLPSTFAIGDTIGVIGSGAGGWVINANTSRTIKLGNQTTSSGGTLASTNRYDCATVCGIVASTTWNTERYTGNITYT